MHKPGQMRIPSKGAGFAHSLIASRVCKVLAQDFQACAERVGKAKDNLECAEHPEV